MKIFIIAILIISELGLVLAQLGHFSLLALLIPAAVILAIMCKARPWALSVRGFASHILLLLPILAVAAILFFQPYQYMDGGWDPGNYINTGVHIAKTGSLAYQDEVLTDGRGIKYPGLYIQKGLVVPQFFYLYPVWIAVFYKLFGLPAVFYVNPFFALCSVILIFLIARKAIGKNYALLAAFLLSINTIQVWNARFSTSEILGQFLLLGGFYLWMRYLDSNDRFFAFWSGVCFGEFLLVSITSLLVIPAIIIYLFYRLNKRDIWFVLPFFLLIGHLIIQLSTFSSIYLESVIMFFRRKEIYLAIGAFIFFSGLILTFRRFLKIPLIILILALFGYGYFIRPHISNSIEALNLVELGNYISLFGLTLAVIGLVLLIYKEKREDILLFAITALVWAVFFIYDKRMFSRYPFALRRYIPVVIPAYCFCISYFCWFMNNKFKTSGRLISIAAICLVVVVPFKRCKDIITVRDNYGWPGFWAEFTKHMETDAVYITNHYRWARPLKDIFDKRVIAYSDGLLARLLEGSKDIYYISDLSMPYSLDMDFLEVYRKSIQFRYMEHSLTFPPGPKERELCFKIFKVIPIEESDVFRMNEYVINMGGDSMGLIKGFDRFRQFSGEVSGRWTLDEAELIIPWFGDNIAQVIAIKGNGMPEEAGASYVSIYIDNQPVIENYFFGEAPKEYSFSIPSKKINTGNKKRVILTIKSNTWCPAESGIKGYPAKLGILIDLVNIKKAAQE